MRKWQLSNYTELYFVMKKDNVNKSSLAALPEN